MDDALAHGLVQLAGGLAGELLGLLCLTGVGGLAELADGGLQGRPDGLVALVRLVVGADSLDLRLNICHEVISFSLKINEGASYQRSGLGSN